MPLEKKEFPHYVYIHYIRGGQKDFDSFKVEMLNLSSSLSVKDVVVDLYESRILTSPEINCVVRLVKAFQGSVRSVRVIMNDAIERTFDSLNLTKLQNIVCYKSRIAFQESAKNL